MSDPVYHRDVIQGTDEWLAQCRGILTASEVGLILTPTLKVANNEKTRSHLYELLAQRITGYVEPRYVSDDMLRGQDDELEARALYAKHYAPVEQCGFVTRQFDWGVLGYSPDGLVGDDGLLECKSRLQKHQVKTILDWHCEGATPSEYLLQCQTGLLVTQRKWIDLVSYSGGLPLCVMRMHQDEVMHEAIMAAHQAFEKQLRLAREEYDLAIQTMVPTTRRVEQEMFIGGET